MRPSRIVPAVLALLFLGVRAPLPAQDTAEELYQAALYQEEVQGNLQRAIDQFGRILVRFPGNRTVGAKAQLHIGLCYEKLGQQEAQQAYRRVIAEFPEHAAEVAMARERLAGIERSAAELNRQPVFRKIEIPSRPQNGVLSPSGDSLAFVSQGSLWVVPLQSEVGPDVPGEAVVLARGIGAWDVSNLLSWSADGKWVAVNSENPDPEGSVFVVPVAGGAPRVLPRPPSGGHAYSYRLSLSSDGQSLAFTALPPGSTTDLGPQGRYVYTVSTLGGEPKPLTEGRTPAVSPDGSLVAFVRSRARANGSEDEGAALRFEGGLWAAPVAGGVPVRLATVDGRLAGPVWSPDGHYIAVRYEGGGDNNSREIRVYPLNADRSAAGEPVKIPLPRSSLAMIAGWTADGELGVFMESEAHDALYTVPSSGGKAVQVSPVVDSPLYPRWSLDGNRIYFRTWREDRGGVVGIGYVPGSGGEITPLIGEGEKEVGSRIPGGGLTMSPDGRNMVVAGWVEPYSTEEGVDLWVVPLDGGAPLRLPGPFFEGYPVWTPDGKWIVFTRNAPPRETGEDNGFQAVFRIPSRGGEAERLTASSDSVSGPLAVSPDGNRIAFASNGRLETIPMAGGPATVLLEGVQINDHSDLAWSPDGSRIAWNGGGKIWIAPGDGSSRPVALLTGLPEDARHGTFSWSPDGSRIVFRGTIGGEDELWLISDFLPTEAGR